jgi:hypothetical protein
MPSFSQDLKVCLEMRPEPSQHVFFVPAERSANESESTLEGPTTTQVAVLPADETYMRK